MNISDLGPFGRIRSRINRVALPSVFLDDGTYGINTIAKGVLTAMRFPDGKIFQSTKQAARYR
jgi:hypothetical protein